MKTIIRYLVPLTGLAAALPAAHAQDSAPPPPDQKEMRVMAGPDDNVPPPPAPGHHDGRGMAMRIPREMESVTFLGIATSPAGGALADQLDLPKDAGLVVNTIMPDSPAASVLKRHDVLVKLDDQQLIEQRQLSVLIRNHQPGDEITLTFIRGGKEMTARVKLAKHDAPKMSMLDDAHAQAFAYAMGNGETMSGAGREHMDRVLSLMGRDEASGPGEINVRTEVSHAGVNGEPGMHSVSVNTSNSNMVFSDNQGSLDLTIKDGKQTLIAKNAKGEQVFSGPVTTPEERSKLTPDVRLRLEKLEAMQDFSFKTDGDFQPGEPKDIRPQHQGIVLPRSESAPASAGHAPISF